MLIPTGVDCAIGGHAGDATPAARLLASRVRSLDAPPERGERLGRQRADREHACTPKAASSAG